MIEKDEFSVGKSTILMDTLKRVISTFDNPPMKEKEPMRNEKQTQNISIDHIIIIIFINRIDLMIFFFNHNEEDVWLYSLSIRCVYLSSNELYELSSHWNVLLLFSLPTHD